MEALRRKAEAHQRNHDFEASMRSEANRKEEALARMRQEMQEKISYLDSVYAGPEMQAYRRWLAQNG